jgi:flavin-dependent dehydrogenase
MGGQRPQGVAILGGGPAGATVAARIARGGSRVVLFSQGKRPGIIVGESLVPAIIPYLQDLGIEAEIAARSVRKEGATFLFNAEDRMHIRFDEVRGARNTYSYNVPRDHFDATLLEAARREGVTIIDHPARVHRVEGTDRAALSSDSLEAAGLGEQPDFIIDAGGRRRTLARAMGIECIDGERRDAALHAHFQGVEIEIEGNVHTDRLEHGWNWRIPLQDRQSLGVVVDADYIRKFGDSPDEQLDNFIQSDPVLSSHAATAQRITPVVRYTNYQSRAARGAGENWALVGDAFGFVDPVFSSGVLIAFQSAGWLAEAVLAGTPQAMARYEERVSHNLKIWHQVIHWFYDGRLLTLFRVGEYVRKTWRGRLVDWHFRKHMPKIFTGEDVTNRYSFNLVHFMVKYALAGNDPEELRIQ